MSKLDLVFRNQTKNTFFNRVFFENVINVALDKLNIIEPQVEISLNIVGSSRIKSLNNKYRGKNKITDVLSFPLIDFKSHITRNYFKKNDILSLGDIFVCLDVAQQDAKNEGIDIERKLCFLAVHGFLHLLGYDHERSKKDEKIMFAMQDKILSNFK